MKLSIPEFLAVSPVTIPCSLCSAKPNMACATSAGGALEIVHVARIKAAAQMDVAARIARKN